MLMSSDEVAAVVLRDRTWSCHQYAGQTIKEIVWHLGASMTTPSAASLSTMPVSVLHAFAELQKRGERGSSTWLFLLLSTWAVSHGERVQPPPIVLPGLNCQQLLVVVEVGPKKTHVALLKLQHFSFYYCFGS